MELLRGPAESFPEGSGDFVNSPGVWLKSVFDAQSESQSLLSAVCIVRQPGRLE